MFIVLYRVVQGIPFAAPPTGSLRLLPPQPATPWSGVLDLSQEFPVMCPQFQNMVPVANDTLSGGQ